MKIKNTDQLLKQLESQLDSEDFKFIKAKLNGIGSVSFTFKKLAKAEYQIETKKVSLPLKFEEPKAGESDLTFFVNRKPITFSNTETIEQLWQKVEKALPHVAERNSIFFNQAHALPLVAALIPLASLLTGVAVGVSNNLNCGTQALTLAACSNGKISEKAANDLAEFYFSSIKKFLRICKVDDGTVQNCLYKNEDLLNQTNKHRLSPERYPEAKTGFSVR